MRGVVTFVVACLASLVVVAFAGDDAPPPPKQWTSADKKFSVSLPADWAVKQERVEDAEIALSVEMSGGLGHADFALLRCKGALNARRLAGDWAADSASWKKNGLKVLEGPRSGFDPVPWAWVRVGSGDFVGDEWVGFRVVRRNAFVLRVDFGKAAWPKVEAACVAAAQSVTTTLPLWPEPPAGYRRVARGGYEFHVHPDVPDAEIDGVQKRLREVETAFVKWHGPVDWSADAPFVVAVNPTLLAAEKCSPSIHGHSYSGNCADLELNRMSVVTPAKDDARTAPEFARETWRSLLDQGGFDGYPYWLALGESQAASAEAMSGKPLPAVADSVLNSIPRPLPRLDELSKIEHADWESTYAMFAYVAFFRLGPKPWRDAFAAFEKDGAATRDWRASETKHLASLDPTKLRDAAQGFLARNLTSVKSR